MAKRSNKSSTKSVATKKVATSGFNPPVATLLHEIGPMDRLRVLRRYSHAQILSTIHRLIIHRHHGPRFYLSRHLRVLIHHELHGLFRSPIVHFHRERFSLVADGRHFPSYCFWCCFRLALRRRLRCRTVVITGVPTSNNCPATPTVEFSGSLHVPPKGLAGPLLTAGLLPLQESNCPRQFTPEVINHLLALTAVSLRPASSIPRTFSPLPVILSRSGRASSSKVGSEAKLYPQRIPAVPIRRAIPATISEYFFFLFRFLESQFPHIS